MAPVNPEPIQYARLPEGIVVIKVIGKGTHLQSPALRHVFEITRDLKPAPQYIFDLEQCTMMDSTFMGTMASIGLYQRNALGTQTIVTNMDEHVHYLLDTLGLKYIMDLRTQGREPYTAQAERNLKPVESPNISHVDRIVMMIEAHERLVSIDNQNEVKFQGVLKSLRESLERAEDQ